MLVVCLAELANHIDSETIRSPIMTKALFISSILTKRMRFRNSGYSSLFFYFLKKWIGFISVEINNPSNKDS